MGIIAAELIRAGAKSESDKHVDAERIGEMIYEAGTGKALATLQLCLVDAATGGRTASGKRRRRQRRRKRTLAPPDGAGPGRIRVEPRPVLVIHPA